MQEKPLAATQGHSEPLSATQDHPEPSPVRRLSMPQSAFYVEQGALSACPECCESGALEILTTPEFPDGGKESLRDSRRRRWRIRCNTCRLVTPWARKLYVAAIAWNRGKGLYHRGRPPAERLDDDHGFSRRMAPEV